MKINIFNQFTLIPNNKSINHKIPIFATQQYADFLKETKNYETIWFEGISGSNIHYLIPFAVKKKGPFKNGMFLTATISLGKINTIEYEKVFLNELINIIKKYKLCDWIQQSPNWAIFNTSPDGAIYVLFGSYRIDLNTKSNEELFRSIRSADRKDINKAIREKVEIKKGIEYLDPVYQLIKDTLDKANIKYPSKDEMINIYYNLKDSFWIYVAYFKNIPQSGVIFFSNLYATYGIFGGSIKRPARGATTLLHWEAIKDSKKKGVRIYDFVGARLNPIPGSKQERIQKFKEHFGVVLEKGYLWKMSISKIKYRIYIIAVKCMCILNGKKYKGDIIDQEIKKLG